MSNDGDLLQKFVGTIFVMVFLWQFWRKKQVLVEEFGHLRVNHGCLKHLNL